MHKFVLGRWKYDPKPRWFQHITASRLVVCDAPTIGVYLAAIDPMFSCEAGSLAEAEVKFSVGAAEFLFVCKGKSLYDSGLTEGDRNAVKRAVDGLLGVMSDEAITFLLTVGGIMPGESEQGRRHQLAERIIGNS